MEFIEEAIIEAKKAYQKKEIPVGAVLVKNGVIVARNHNSKESDYDPTQHAEIKVIREYSRKIKNWRLNDCELYTTLEPCLMCAGAIIQSRIRKVVYCCKNSKVETSKLVRALSGDSLINHTISWQYYPKKEFKPLLKGFFKEQRKISKNKKIKG